MRDGDAVREAVRAAAPELVYHLASLTSVGRSWESPAQTAGRQRRHHRRDARGPAPRRRRGAGGVGELVRGLRHPGGAARRPRTWPLRPANPYAVSKASGEMLAEVYADAYGLEIAPRPAVQPFGPRSAADLPALLAGLPGGRGPPQPASRSSRSSPGTPTRAGTSPTCATSCAPTACWPRRWSRASRARRGRLQRQHRPLGVRGRAGRAAAPSCSRRSRSSTSSTPRASGATRSWTSAATRRGCATRPAGSPSIPLRQTMADTIEWWEREQARGGRLARALPGGTRPQAPARLDSRARLAQLVEHLICNQAVGGSSPPAGSLSPVTRIASSGAVPAGSASRPNFVAGQSEGPRPAFLRAAGPTRAPWGRKARAKRPCSDKHSNLHQVLRYSGMFCKF